MDCVLAPSEIEFYVETMKPRALIDIGSSNWLEWNERIQKLSQQAIIEASAVKEESVKEALVTHGKINVLVHEAILINVWKHKILPLLLRLENNPKTTFIAYSILYHEAVVVGLLELVMFHPNTCDSLSDSASDLLEYAYEAAAQLLVIEVIEPQVNEKSLAELVRQKEDLAFIIGLRCLSIIRYLSENMDRISVGLVSRIYSVHDVPVLLIQIMLRKPWLKNGKEFKNGKWINNNSDLLNSSEAQVWLTLRYLLLDKACMDYYEITNSRRSALMKLLPLMSPVLLDQLSPLMELNRFLNQISVSDLPSAQHKPILLEVVLEIKQGILQEGRGKWKKIAKEQLNVVFCTDKQKLVEIAQKLSSAYNTDLIEKFEAKPQGVCVVCGISASHRCSKCKKDWYCSRKCQVDDWNNHKINCIKNTTE